MDLAFSRFRVFRGFFTFRKIQNCVKIMQKFLNAMYPGGATPSATPSATGFFTFRKMQNPIIAFFEKCKTSAKLGICIF